MDIYTDEETSDCGKYSFRFTDILIREFKRNGEIMLNIFCQRIHGETGDMKEAICTINLDAGGGDCFASWEYDGGSVYVELEEARDIPGRGRCIYQLMQEWDE